MTTPTKISLAERFTRFTEAWSPKIVAELNGQHVKLARLDGEFVWHAHDDEDELFLVVEGTLVIEFRDAAGAVTPVELAPGEMIVVPRGVEHRPVAREEVQVLLFEPASTVNTGDAGGEHTAVAEWLE